MIHTKKWFLNRVGKRVYRDATTCKCSSCKDTVENGLIIANEQHAKYLYSVQIDYAVEGELLNYRDK